MAGNYNKPLRLEAHKLSKLYYSLSLIAVNYQARAFNVKRGMKGELAKSICPEFHTFYVKQTRGKADLTK